MLNQYKNIWIDATDLLDWRGHFTGIQRVEFNLAIRFEKWSNVRFFAVEGPEIFEVDFAALRAHIEAEVVSKTTEERGAVPERSAQRRWLKSTLGKVVRATPFIPIETAVGAYDTVAHQAKLAKQSAQQRRVQQGREKRLPKPFLTKRTEFDRGDLVLVLGGNWHIAHYMENLGRAIRRTDNIAFAHVIYDLIPALQPAFFPQELVVEFKAYMKLLLEDADVCLAISEHSKADAIRFAAELGVEAPPIHTFRLGDHIDASEPSEPDEWKKICAQLGGSQPFVFCPGTIEVRKNHRALYHAYRLAAQRGLELPHLIIGGKRGWLAGDVAYQMEHDPLVNKSIVLLTACTDSEFAWLYTNTALVVYPSLYEGWGLPVAEALQYGKFCLASDASSIPEIGGDLIEYFSPDDTVELMEKLYRFTSDAELLQKHEAEIEASYRPKTWDYSFDRVVEVLQGLSG